MKKTINIDGNPITVDFSYKVNSTVEICDMYSQKNKIGDLFSIIGYDFNIDNRIFKIIYRCYIAEKRFLSTRCARYVVSIPGITALNFPDNHKKIIEFLYKIKKEML